MKGSCPHTVTYLQDMYVHTYMHTYSLRTYRLCDTCMYVLYICVVRSRTPCRSCSEYIHTYIRRIISTYVRTYIRIHSVWCVYTIYARICTYVYMYVHLQCIATVVNSCSYFIVVSCRPAAQRVAKEMNLHDDLVYYFALHIVTEEEDGSFTGKPL